MLSVSDVTLARGGLPVVTGLSFTLNAGQALVLRGPNGSGKTTVLRAVAGLAQPISGRIETDAEAIAYAAHADGIKAMATVAENLQFWSDIFGSNTGAKALAAFELAALKYRRAGDLSAGQKRRLGLARLVATGAKLWILDEPTVSLDAEGRARFGRVMADHLAQGGAALLATHIDLGFDAPALDITAYRAAPDATHGASDEAFL